MRNRRRLGRDGKGAVEPHGTPSQSVQQAGKPAARLRESVLGRRCGLVSAIGQE